MLKMRMEIEGQSTSIVNVEFWMHVLDARSFKFLEEFQGATESLREKVTLNVKYKFTEISSSFSTDTAKRMCYANYKYCDFNTFGFNSLDVIDEGIRQICGFNIASKEDHPLENYMAYIASYRRCLENAIQNVKTAGTKFDCFSEIKASKTVSPMFISAIETCYTNSFTSPNDKFLSENSALDSHRSEPARRSLNIVPALFLNGSLLKEDIDIRIVISAICSKFLVTPQFCTDFLTSRIDWQAKKNELITQGRKIGIILVAISLVALLVVSYLVRRFHRQRINDEISAYIQNQVDSYLKMQDSKLPNDAPAAT